MSEGVTSSPKPPGFGSSLLGPGQFRDGVIFFLLAAGLFAVTFYISSPTVPRVFAILLGLVGVATSAGLIPVRGREDYCGGLAMIVLAALVLIVSAGLPAQRGFQLFAGVIVALGAALAMLGVLTGEPKLLGPGQFRGGLVFFLLAAGLFTATFYISSPTAPRVVSICLGLLAVATSARLIPVRAPQDYYGGLALIVLATFALVASAELPGQRGFAFGPGTAPRLFAGLLIGLGAAVSVVGVLFDGPKIERYAIRGPALVVTAIIGFAWMIRPVGLIIASYVTFVVAIMGSREMRVIEALIGAAVMTLFCVLLFVYLLNLPFQLWPRF